MPLDPQALGPESSLNRVVIAGLPGYNLDAGIAGKTAYELLRSDTWVGAIEEQAIPLALTEEELQDSLDLPVALELRLGSPEVTVWRAAAGIIGRFGRALGVLVAVLKRGDAVNRAARPEWDDSYWAYWRQVETVWLGGGLASGRLGVALVHAAHETLTAIGLTNCRLLLPEHPALLPLIGAARTAGAGSNAMLVADFGHSYVKRGIAVYEAGALRRMDVLPRLRAEVSDRSLALRIGEMVSESWQEAAKRGRLDGNVRLSIAAYVQDNQPMDYRRGAYAPLRDEAANLGAWLSRQVSAEVERPLTVELIHDGTAAAQAAGGTPNTAVIMLGTALGAGYPWPAGKVLPVARDFEVRFIS